MMRILYIYIFINNRVKYCLIETDEELLEEAQEEPALPKDLKHIPYQYVRLPEKETLSRASEFYQIAAARRTLRYFSADPVPKEVIREIIRAAGIYVSDICLK